MEKVTASYGDCVKPDEWMLRERLEEDENPFSDSSFPGCQFRVSCNGYKIAVNVKTTGRPQWNGEVWKSRCRIEFVGDGEPSEFSGGILYHNVSLKDI